MGPAGLELQAHTVETPFGPTQLHRVVGSDAYLVFRHGLPHAVPPHLVNHRAQAWALRACDVGAVLLTSSVGVLDAEVPLNQLALCGDLIMAGNRLPDGSACTVFVPPVAEDAHLVVRGGLFSAPLNAQLRDLAEQEGVALRDDTVVYAHVDGPRTKTPAENEMWRGFGAQVNSMTMGPEVVLANEMEIPVAALVVGHKTSQASADTPEAEGIKASLEQARAAMETMVLAFVQRGEAVPFENFIYRFDP